MSLALIEDALTLFDVGNLFDCVNVDSLSAHSLHLFRVFSLGLR